MGTICFVILNYKTWREAAACAESILKTQQGQDIRIVLVDNGSGNGSEESLREEFAGEKRVHVIASEKNLGFARGNNLGIRYARSHFEPDFIVAANSDIIFEQEDYCEKLREIYKEERFDILGGDIVDASRTRHFNPVARNRQYTLNYMRKQILVSWAKCKMFQLIKLFHLKKAIAGHYGVVSDETGRDVKDGSKNLTTREEGGKSVSADSRVDERMKDVLLHVCCLVFSKDFFKQMDGFYDGTFLYAEEEILYYLAGKYGMTLLYAPEIGCMHKEAVSTNFVMQDFCDAKIFYFGNITKSYRAFLALMKKYE